MYQSHLIHEDKRVHATKMGWKRLKRDDERGGGGETERAADRNSETDGATEQGREEGERESMHCNADTFWCQHKCPVSNYACVNNVSGPNCYNTEEALWE